MTETTCAFTGHRPKSFPWKYNEATPNCVLLKEVLAKQIKLLADRGVPLRYNNDKPENPSNDGRFEGLSHLFHSFSNHEKAGQKS